MLRHEDTKRRLNDWSGMPPEIRVDIEAHQVRERWAIWKLSGRAAGWFASATSPGSARGACSGLTATDAGIDTTSPNHCPM